MCDGYKHNTGLILSTDNFTFQEVQLLIKVLQDNFNLVCSNHTVTRPSTDKVYYRISIRKESMSRLNSLVLPHMLPEMLCKLHL